MGAKYFPKNSQPKESSCSLQRNHFLSQGIPIYPWVIVVRASKKKNPKSKINHRFCFGFDSFFEIECFLHLEMHDPNGFQSWVVYTWRPSYWILVLSYLSITGFHPPNGYLIDTSSIHWPSHSHPFPSFLNTVVSSLEMEIRDLGLISTGHILSSEFHIFFRNCFFWKIFLPELIQVFFCVWMQADQQTNCSLPSSTNPTSPLQLHGFLISVKCAVCLSEYNLKPTIMAVLWPQKGGVFLARKHGSRSRTTTRSKIHAKLDCSLTPKMIRGRRIHQRFLKVDC